MFARADAWRDCPVPRNRLLAINQLALAFYQAQFPDSWGRDYLRDRMGQDLTGDPRFRPGQAPAGWTRLVDHLHRHGVTDQEMLAAGVATTARTGRLIDRFRDRIIFPITNHDGEVLGFVGRRHPDAADTALAGPKYLNTAETPLFHKSAQLFGAQNLTAGQIPVIVEGPIDAIAVTLAGGGRYVGVATARHLPHRRTSHPTRPPRRRSDRRHRRRHPRPGRRRTRLLAPHPPRPQPPPRQLARQHRPRRRPHPPRPRRRSSLHCDRARPLGDALVEERLRHLPAGQARTEAIQIIAAQPPTQWDTASDRIANQLGTPIEQIRRDLLTAVQAWNTDPQGVAQHHLSTINNVKTRLSDAQAVPKQQWDMLAAELDPRLLHQADWPATAALLQAGHDHGHDMAAAARRSSNKHRSADYPPKTSATDSSTTSTSPSKNHRQRRQRHPQRCVMRSPKPISPAQQPPRRPRRRANRQREPDGPRTFSGWNLPRSGRET